MSFRSPITPVVHSLCIFYKGKRPQKFSNLKVSYVLLRTLSQGSWLKILVGLSQQLWNNVFSGYVQVYRIIPKCPWFIQAQIKFSFTWLFLPSFLSFVPSFLRSFSPPFLSHSLTDWLTDSLTIWLTHSLTHALASVLYTRIPNFPHFALQWLVLETMHTFHSPMWH